MIPVVRKAWHLRYLINLYRNFSNIKFFAISLKSSKLNLTLALSTDLLICSNTNCQIDSKSYKMEFKKDVHIHRLQFWPQKNSHAWMNIKRLGEKNVKNLWPFMTSCQENKYFLAGRPDPKAKYQWMHTHPPIFNMIQWILALAGTLEIM